MVRKVATTTTTITTTTKKKRVASKAWKAARAAQIAAENPLGYDKRYHPSAVKKEGNRWMVQYACSRYIL